MKMRKTTKILILLVCTALSRTYAQGTPPSPQELIQDAEIAAQKLTGGLIQIADDKRIENQIASSGNFHTCQDAFQKKVKEKSGALVTLTEVPECNKIIPDKKEELEELAKKLNPYSEAFNFQKDANYKAMYGYLNERLETALYGDKNNPNDKSLHLVDHKNFYELYKSQISRKFLFDISNYCLEVFGPKNPNAFDKDRIQDDPGYNYKKWMEDQIRKGNTKQLGAEFGICMISLPCNCYGEIDLKKYCPDKTKIQYVNDPKVKQQACVLTARLKQLKQEVIALKEIDKGFTKLEGSSGLNSNNVTRYDPTEKGKSADDLTLVSTGDYQKAATDIEQKEKEFKSNCSDPKNAARLTDDKCADISRIESNKFADIQMEYQLKTKALTDNIQNMDKEKLEQYLKDQKKTEEEIKQLWADHQGDFDKIKTKVKEEMLTERQQIIKEIADQINQNSAITDSLDNNKTALNENGKVKKVAENQVEKTKRLIQYNNIVTAYLATQDEKTKKSGHYTKGLEREIASTDGRTSADDKKYFEQLKSDKNTLSPTDQSDALDGASLLTGESIDKILGNAK